MPNENRALRSRLDFSKIPTAIQIPNLIEVQRRSYERFLQMDKLPSEREDNGLQSVFTSVFPITDFRNISQLDFVDFSIGNWECKCGHLKGLHHLRTTCVSCGAMVITDPFHPGDVLCHKCGTYNKNTPDFCNKCGDPVGLQLKYDQSECEERGMTYSAPLKVTVRLTIYDKDAETGAKSIRDIKEQEVFFGDIPLMTQNGTFIVNGTERVIVSQLHRSPGVFFETASNRTYFLGKIIPYRGSWVEFEYDQKNTLYVRIDRKRKFLGTIFLRALGLKSDEEILKTFYTVDTINVTDGKLHWTISEDATKPTHLLGAKPAHAVLINGEEVAHSGRKITPSILKALRAKVASVEVEAAELDSAVTAADVVDTTTGEVIVEANLELTSERLHRIVESGVTTFEVFFPERDDVGNIITNTLRRDSVRKPEEALIEIYRKLRPGDPPTLDTGDPRYGVDTEYVAQNATFDAYGIPYLYFPTLVGRVTQKGGALRSIYTESNARFGTGVRSTWGLFESFGILPPEDLDLQYHADWLTRGEGTGLDGTYQGGFIDETTKQPWDFQGKFTSYFFSDHQKDILGADRQDVTPRARRARAIPLGTSAFLPG